jgi:hypothetical protein
MSTTADLDPIRRMYLDHWHPSPLWCAPAAAALLELFADPEEDWRTFAVMLAGTTDHDREASAGNPEDWPGFEHDDLTFALLAEDGLANSKGFIHPSALAAWARANSYPLPGWFDDLHPPQGEPEPEPEAKQERFIFQKEGTGYRIEIDGQTAHVRGKYAEVMHAIISRPHEELRRADLDPSMPEATVSNYEATLEATDEKAIKACRQRLEELEEEIEAARAAGNTEIVIRLEDEHSKCFAYLSENTNHRGQPRRTASETSKDKEWLRKTRQRFLELKDLPDSMALYVESYVTMRDDAIHHEPPETIQWKT